MSSTFDFLKIYFSPFKRPKIDFYIGEVAIGTPYFYPRNWVKFTKKDALEKAMKDCQNKNLIYYGKNPLEIADQFLGYTKPVPKKIGFDFVPLRVKTKWSDTDYRYESCPIWSFVFFRWQIALLFGHKYVDHYYTCWLIYDRHTDKTKNIEDRIKQAKKIFPCIWTSSKDGVENKTCYWDYILKDKYYE